MDYNCFFCQIHAFEKLLKKNEISVESKNKAVKNFCKYLSSINKKVIAPEIARETNIIIKKLLKIDDPYRKGKQKSNEFLLTKYNEFKNKVISSKNSFDKALRLSIAGNIIDSIGAPESDIMDTIEKVLKSDFSIDDSLKLQEEINKAKTILYLGDNAGEIVLDKLFIETINHKNLYYAVRGAAVINDVTIEDANFVKMNSVAKVISNGYDAPSTILNKVSDEFKNIYNEADLIISKGMGNLEALLNNGNNKIFFLLMVKCETIGRLINVKKNDFVVMQNVN